MKNVSQKRGNSNGVSFGEMGIALFFFKNHACFDKIYMLVLNIRT
jgi:hypothetical protein